MTGSITTSFVATNLLPARRREVEGGDAFVAIEPTPVRYLVKRWLMTAVLVALATSGSAQVPVSPIDTTAMVLSNAQRPMVTRPQLEAALAQIEQDLKSGAYSTALRSAKATEADAIRERLAQGDFHVGDIISITVQGDASFNGDYPVNSNDAITLHGGTEVSMRGLLRSEVQSYLNQKFGAWVHDPGVRVTLSLRVTVLGAINKPGFYYVHADWLLNEVLMTAAQGLASNARLDHSQIKRGDKVIVDGAGFAEAIRVGRTMDELNIQNGDEINVAAAPTGGTFLRALGILSAVGGLAYLAIRIF